MWSWGRPAPPAGLDQAWHSTLLTMCCAKALHSRMNATPFLVGRHPRALHRWRAFPIIGAQVHDFVQWLGVRGYADSSVGSRALVTTPGNRFAGAVDVGSFRPGLQLLPASQSLHQPRSA